MKLQKTSIQEIVGQTSEYMRRLKYEGKTDLELLHQGLALVSMVTHEHPELETIALPTLRALMRRMSN